MNYVLNSPPGTYEHRARECKVCGVDQAAFYRAYKSDDPLRCTVCGTIEGSMREAQASTPNLATTLVRELEAATEQRSGVVARVNGADLHAEAAELRAEVDRLAGELVAQQERVRKLCDAVTAYDAGYDSDKRAVVIETARWVAHALLHAGKEAAAPKAEPLCWACGRAYAQHADDRPAGAPVPRTPCLLLKANFKPAPPAKEPTP